MNNVALSGFLSLWVCGMCFRVRGWRVCNCNLKVAWVILGGELALAGHWVWQEEWGQGEWRGFYGSYRGSLQLSVGHFGQRVELRSHKRHVYSCQVHFSDPELFFSSWMWHNKRITVTSERNTEAGGTKWCWWSKM